ncbi:MAG: hypothetical protein OES26_03085 [Gammaproteobacteria bacterium]|nr:hypothetical protein [Gammaproteobacteria bacterium]
MKVSRNDFDMSGFEVRRLLKSFFDIKLVPFWRRDDSPDWSSLMTLWVRHAVGYPLAYLTERYHKQWLKLLQRWRRTVARFRGWSSGLN